MSDNSVLPYIEKLLTKRELRSLIRTKRTVLVPENLAKRIRDTAPLILSKDAADIAGILEQLANTVREGLLEAGIEPFQDFTSQSDGLTTREREYAANFGALLCWLAASLQLIGNAEKATELGQEGVEWSRLSGNALQEGQCLLVLARLLHAGPDKTIRAYRDVVETVKRSGTQLTIAEALAELSSQLVNYGKFDEAQKIIGEGLNVLSKITGSSASRMSRSRFLTNMGRIYVGRHQFREAIRQFQEALQWSDETTNPIGRSATLQQLGDLYRRLYHFDNSLKCQQEALKLMTDLGLVEYQGWILVAMCTTYLKIEEYAKGMELLERAEGLPIPQAGTLYFSLRTLRAEFMILATKEYQEAEELLAKIIAQATDSGINVVALPAHALSAVLSTKTEQYEKAEDHIRKGLQLSRSSSMQKTVRLMLDLSENLVRQKRYDEAADYLNEVEEKIEQHSAVYVKFLHVRSGLHEGLGEYQTALLKEREAAEVERDLLKERADQSFRNARLVAETELLEQEMSLIQERYQQLEHELSEAVLRFSDQRKLIDSVVKRLQQALNNQSIEKKESLSATVKTTVQELRGIEQQSEPLLYYLHNVGEEFYQKLRERWPHLTQKQERFCVLIQAALSTKEIASLLELKPEGMKSQRRRLRAALGLTPDQKIEEALRSCLSL